MGGQIGDLSPISTQITFRVKESNANKFKLTNQLNKLSNLKDDQDKMMK